MDVMPRAVAVILRPREVKPKDKYLQAEGARVEDDAID